MTRSLVEEFTGKPFEYEEILNRFEDYVSANPKITSDREAPRWFLDELTKIDSGLRVIWWNHPPHASMDGPTFELIRLHDEGWSNVEYFKVCSQTLINKLRRIDQANRGKLPAEIYEEAMRSYEYEQFCIERERDEKWAQKKEDFLREALRPSNHRERVYSYEGKRG